MLEYKGKIGIDFENALESLLTLQGITSEIEKIPLEVLFDNDDRLFFGIAYGDCLMYSDVLDTKGNYYQRSWYCAEDTETRKGYWVGEEFIELHESNNGIYLVVLKDIPNGFDYSADAYEEALGVEGLEIESVMGDNGVLVKSDSRPEILGTYVSYSYFTDHYFVLIPPRISICLSDGFDINSLLDKYTGVLSVKNKVNRIYRLNCDVSNSDELLHYVAKLHDELGMEWCEPAMISSEF